jgi:hypothetical protein
MSVASSAASERSCVFEGKEMTVEQALSQVTRKCQGRLTDLEMCLCRLCALEDQAIDEDDDWKMAVEIDDQVNDMVSELIVLLSELVPISADIRGKPPHKEALTKYKLHVAKRKEAKKAAAAEKKALAKAAKEEAKLL